MVTPLPNGTVIDNQALVASAQLPLPGTPSDDPSHAGRSTIRPASRSPPRPSSAWKRPCSTPNGGAPQPGDALRLHASGCATPATRRRAQHHRDRRRLDQPHQRGRPRRRPLERGQPHHHLAGRRRGARHRPAGALAGEPGLSHGRRHRGLQPGQRGQRRPRRARCRATTRPARRPPTRPASPWRASPTSRRAPRPSRISTAARSSRAISFATASRSTTSAPRTPPAVTVTDVVSTLLANVAPQDGGSLTRPPGPHLEPAQRGGQGLGDGAASWPRSRCPLDDGTPIANQASIAATGLPVVPSDDPRHARQRRPDRGHGQRRAVFQSPRKRA